MKKVIILVAFFSIFFVGSEANAFNPPVGCDADSWILMRDPMNVKEFVTFFKSDVFVCSTDLHDAVGGSIDWFSSNYVFHSSGIVGSNFKDLSSIMSFFAGLLAVSGFVAGVHGGKG